MPISYKTGKREIKEWIESQITGTTYTIFDLGCGYGTYGHLITKPCRMFGVDTVDYSESGNWKDCYENTFICNILDIDRYLQGLTCDMAILGDVLEHLSVGDAQDLLFKLQCRAKAIVIAVPYLYPQNSRNVWEIHKQPDLTPEVFDARYPGFKLYKLVRHKDGKPKYGYYVWRRES